MVQSLYDLRQAFAQIRRFLLGSAGLRFFVQWLDRDGQPIAVPTDSIWRPAALEALSDWIGATTDWTLEQFVVRAPEGAVSARIGCRLASTMPGRENPNVQRVAWIDEVEKVGEGQHRRVIVELGRFRERVEAKRRSPSR